MYALLTKVLFRFPAERIHHLVFGLLKLLTLVPPLGAFVRRVLGVTDPVLAQQVLGRTFPGPLGLAAGFDKNAAAVDSWGALGFGFSEVGTVTASPQPGNPAPRLFRLVADRAILNRMGFNNHGAGNAANNLRRRRSGDPVGINIGKTKVVPAEDAVRDYVASTTVLTGLADYLVVNVSSPNTPGLRDLQAVESLRPILVAVRDAATIPVLVKISPDLADDATDAVTDLVLEPGLAGSGATNTTISRSGLRTPAADLEALGAGGISGAPVAARSREVLSRIYARAGGRMVIISVGGVETPEDVWDRITHGADLVQTYTGFIYAGPSLVRGANRLVARRLRQGGFGSLAEAVGSAVR